mgnify:CR=1 FL=1
MTAIFWRILVFALVGALIFFGVRRIWRDWKGTIKAEDDETKRLRRQRDLRERKRPDVITLERGKDGTFRPPGKDDDRA